jgi:hypothetical protein
LKFISSSPARPIRLRLAYRARQRQTGARRPLDPGGVLAKDWPGNISGKKETT